MLLSEVLSNFIAAQIGESWSRLPNLQRIIIAHGNIIDDDPRGVLARIAEDLAA